METTHGTWGNRHRVFQNSTCLVTVLELEPHKRCSWHSHETAFNLFYVVSGRLGVKTDKGYTSMVYPFRAFNVEPGVKHEFQTYESLTIVVEIAYVQFNEHDITRERLGGTMELSDGDDQ